MTKTEEPVAAAYLAIRDRAAKWIALGPDKAWSHDALHDLLYFGIERFREAFSQDDRKASAALRDLGLLPSGGPHPEDAGKSFEALRECYEKASMCAGAAPDLGT